MYCASNRELAQSHKCKVYWIGSLHNHLDVLCIHQVACTIAIRLAHHFHKLAHQISDSHTLSINSHTISRNSHTISINSHTIPINSHTISINSHNKSNSHTKYNLHSNSHGFLCEIHPRSESRTCARFPLVGESRTYLLVCEIPRRRYRCSN